mmetsp:Transcript_17015/g.34783  ORF Transcript_17015/g.34783 Transcript_17015/m.34783 type:complete len:158 (-) Transcript_17015:227-700(-)
MGSVEDCVALAGASGACAMAFVSFLSLLDLAFSASVLRAAAESVVLLMGGLVCLQGETRLFYSYHEVVQENFGFALKPLGRGSAYLLAGLYCSGARAASSVEASEGRSPAFGLLWYACCLLMILGGAASLWTWRGERRSVALGMDDASDFDGYYVSS